MVVDVMLRVLLCDRLDSRRCVYLGFGSTGVWRAQGQGEAREVYVTISLWPRSMEARPPRHFDIMASGIGIMHINRLCTYMYTCNSQVVAESMGGMAAAASAGRGYFFCARR